MDPDATRGSAGVGWLIAEEWVNRASVKVERPTFAGSQDARFRLLMAEDTPREIDMLLYRYLIQILGSRERGPSGPAQGVGPRA